MFFDTPFHIFFTKSPNNYELYILWDRNTFGEYSFLNNRETWIIGMYRGTKIQEESFNDFLMASLFWYKSRWKPWFSADYIGNMQS